MKMLHFEFTETLFSLVFICCCAKISASSEYVPVYVWGTQNAAQPSPALQRISEDSFKDLLLSKLESNPSIVVFTEETLSPEDFAQHDRDGNTPFMNLRKYLQSSNVDYKPYVQNPIGAIKQLDRAVTEISLASLLRDFKVPQDEILIVDLNDAKDDEQRINLLRRHDEAISEIYERMMKSNDNILAIYTSHHMSWVTPEEMHHRNARSLLQEAEAAETQNETSTEKVNETAEKQNKVVEEPPSAKPMKANSDQSGSFITNDNLLLFHVTSSPMQSNDGGVTYKPVDLTTESCTKDNDNINLKLKGGKNYNLLITIGNDGYWTLTKVDVSDETYSFPEIYAPLGFSYHCHNVSFASKNGKDILMLPGMQIEPFLEEMKGGNVFSDPYDCVGFTSIPIWSGILVTLVFLIILTFGITLIMDIKTMDKFDDAKGKTITINVSE